MEGTCKSHEGLQDRVWREHDSDRDNKNDRSLHSPRHSHRETVSTMEKQDRGSSFCEDSNLSCRNSEKDEELRSGCLHSPVHVCAYMCVCACIYIHVHTCILDLNSITRNVEKVSNK